MFASKDTLLTRPSGYNIARSVRLRSSATAYLSRTPSSTTNRRTWTWSGWMKRGTDKYSLLFAAGNVTDIWNTGTNCTLIGYWINTNQLVVYDNGTVFRQTQQVFRDFSAWYHIVVAFDTTQATAANRLRVYINGAEVTSWDTNAAPTQNLDMAVNVNQNHFVGGQSTNVANAYFDGYLTEINFVDGQQLTPSSFGETDSITGVWKPKAYSGTYGTNGFELNFSDNSNNTAATIGKDYSGNGNNWTPNNISVTAGATYDSMTDVPTLTSATAANYCVLNPLLGDALDLPKDGNLKVGGTANNYSVGTIAFPTTGKFYAEATVTTYSSGQIQIGICPANATSNLGSDATAYFQDGTTTKNNSASTTLTSYTQGDLIGIAVDVDNSTVQFYKNNSAQTALTGVLRITTASFFTYMSISSSVVNYNFGQRPFSYTPPSGFVALNTYNLPASTITNGAAYMAATTYTGTGATQVVSNAVNGVGMQPDLVWLKSRSNPRDHRLMDSVRGINNVICSNLTIAEFAGSALSSINSNGYTLNTTDVQNVSSETYIGWQWKAGGTSASNTNGTITSTVSVGATQGFSVVTYTGTGATATVGHGLGVKPAFIIVKRRTGTGGWVCWHQSLTGGSEQDRYIYLDLTSASGTTSSYWGSGITSSTFGVSATGGDNNASGATLVAYCFAAVAGYSAFGSFSGNGSADGPFVYTGFRPRFVMIKRTDSSPYNWVIGDTSRNTYNVATAQLSANLSDAENTSYMAIDFVSNGFKLRTTDGAYNASGGTYVYACFAESPFKFANAR